MLPYTLTLLAGLAALVGFVGMLYGVTGRDAQRRTIGLRLLQSGMSLAGLLLILNSFIGGPQDDAFSGFLLLALGTGATAIHPKKSS